MELKDALVAILVAGWILYSGTHLVLVFLAIVIMAIVTMDTVQGIQRMRFSNDNGDHPSEDQVKDSDKTTDNEETTTDEEDIIEEENLNEMSEDFSDIDSGIGISRASSGGEVTIVKKDDTNEKTMVDLYNTMNGKDKNKTKVSIPCGEEAKSRTSQKKNKRIRKRKQNKRTTTQEPWMTVPMSAETEQSKPSQCITPYTKRVVDDKPPPWIQLGVASEDSGMKRSLFITPVINLSLFGKTDKLII